MRLPSRHGRPETDIAMTPMIDVVFQLLIFFICTASFQAAEESLPMAIAAVDDTGRSPQQELEPESERVVLRATRVAGQTQLTLDGRPTATRKEVRRALEELARADRSRSVTLDIAGDVPLGDMIDAYDICRLVGLEKIEFAVEQNSAKGFTTEVAEGME